MRRDPLAPVVVVAVALGGALGAMARWGLGELFPDDGGFPWTIFLINVVGSMLLGLLSRFVDSGQTALVAFVGPGLLGGFTTLSTYSEQTRDLLSSGHGALAVTYAAGTLLACMAAVWVTQRFGPDHVKHWRTP